MKTPLRPPPPPPDVDVVRVVAVGTALWVAALVAALLARDWLAERDAEWVVWAAVAGVGIGLTFGPYAVWRRHRFLREEERNPRQASPEG